MKNKITYITFLFLLTLFSYKKDRQPTTIQQYYGEPIAESREYFLMQELFDFTTSTAVSPNGHYLSCVVPQTISIEVQDCQKFTLCFL